MGRGTLFRRQHSTSFYTPKSQLLDFEEELCGEEEEEGEDGGVCVGCLLLYWLQVMKGWVWGYYCCIAVLSLIVRFVSS